MICTKKTKQKQLLYPEKNNNKNVQKGKLVTFSFTAKLRGGYMAVVTETPANGLHTAVSHFCSLKEFNP